MITPSFALTATERVLPRLALDFTTASLDSRVTFTRSGNTATVTNSSGYITNINANLPRFNYNPTTLACNGLLIEESRINLALRSEEFNSGYWGPVNLTIATPNVTSPRNTLTAQHVYPTTSGSGRRFDVAFSATGGQVYTYSVYGKASGLNWIYLAIGGQLAQSTFFNVSTGQIGSIGTTLPITANIEIGPNGYYRCSITYTRGTTGNAFITIGLCDDNNTLTATANGTDGIDFFGAQVEAGAFATSYIPTTNLTVTRNADVATMTGTNFSSWYNASEGGAVVQVLPSTISNTRPAVEFDDNTANESITLRGVAADPQLFVVDGGSTQATLDAGTIAANTLYKLGGAWKESSYAVALNGAAVVTQASGTFPTATQARLGSDGTNYLNGHLQSLRFWPQRLTNAEVQAFSK